MFSGRLIQKRHMMVLIYEDNAELGRALSLFFEHGYHKRCLVTCSHAKALRKIFAGDIELLVVDIEMDGEDGLDLIRKARSIKRNTMPPVFAFTGLDSDGDRYIEAEFHSDQIFEKGISWFARFTEALRTVPGFGDLSERGHGHERDGCEDRGHERCRRPA